jgi:hypothetical protein
MTECSTGNEITGMTGDDINKTGETDTRAEEPRPILE